MTRVKLGVEICSAAAFLLACAGCWGLGSQVTCIQAELQDGKLVIFHIERPAQSGYSDEAQALDGDYAILIDWPNETSVPRFFLYDRMKHSVKETRSFDRFLQQLDHLPGGSEVCWANTCGGGTAYGMSEENKVRMRRVVLRNRRTLLTEDQGDRFITFCTCEARHMRLPGD